MIDNITSLTYFPKRKYVICNFREMYDKEKFLLSFKTREENHYGEYILGDLKIVKRKGDKITVIHKNHFEFRGGWSRGQIKFSKEDYEKEVYDDLATAELIFEVGNE